MEGQSHLRQNQGEIMEKDAVLSYAITARSSSHALMLWMPATAHPPPFHQPFQRSTPIMPLPLGSSPQLCNEFSFQQEDSSVDGSAIHILLPLQPPASLFHMAFPDDPSWEREAWHQEGSLRPSLNIWGTWHPGSFHPLTDQPESIYWAPAGLWFVLIHTFIRLSLHAMHLKALEINDQKFNHF